MESLSRIGFERMLWKKGYHFNANFSIYISLGVRWSVEILIVLRKVFFEKQKV